MKSFRQELQQGLDERKKNALLRKRRTLFSPQGTQIILDGEPVISFCSNDYLGMADHPDVIQAFHKGLEKFGAGSGASHLVSGHLVPHQVLEEELAAFTGRSKALVFSSGYMANVGVLTTLLGKADAVFEDRLNHASLLDGGLFSGASFKRYAHVDIKALENKLSNAPESDRKLIVSDGVFSMDGDIAPLPELVQVAKEKDSLLMIDDAHGFGVLGKKGGGSVAHWQEAGVDITEDNLQILVGTFGKAFGVSGAFVAGSEELIETLIQFCRPYIYTTAIPPAMAEAIRCGLGLIQKDQWRRDYLSQMISRFRRHCEDLGLSLVPSQTPIQAVLIGNVETTLEASEQLMEQGLFVSAIRPPTVPIGTARLRVTFSAMHTEEQFIKLLDAFERCAHNWQKDL
ncbi:MAG: 8-amino-7-oxononanoate synthase [Gammaproteobacteria bacterium]|nr:8-amino-7-oxononanoate synthase [Gammaproteobacteria bacterium]